MLHAGFTTLVPLSLLLFLVGFACPHENAPQPASIVVRRRSARLASRQRPAKLSQYAGYELSKTMFLGQQRTDSDQFSTLHKKYPWPQQIGTCIFSARVRGDIGRSGAALKCQLNDTIHTSDGLTMPASEAKRRDIAVECDHSLEVQEVLRALIEPLRRSLLDSDPDSLRSICAQWERNPTFNQAIDHLLNGVTNLHFAAKDVNYEKGLMVVGKSSSRNARDNPGLYAALGKHMELIRAKRAHTADDVVRVLDRFYGEYPQAPRPGNYTLTVVEFMRRGREMFEEAR